MGACALSGGGKPGKTDSTFIDPPLITPPISCLLLLPVMRPGLRQNGAASTARLSRHPWRIKFTINSGSVSNEEKVHIESASRTCSGTRPFFLSQKRSKSPLGAGNLRGWEPHQQ